MFRSKAPSLPTTTDFTGSLRETSFYKYGHLRQFGLEGEITALAVDPVHSLLAVGTSAGTVHVFGYQALHFVLPVSVVTASGRPAPIKFLAFHPGHGRLMVVDESNTIHAFTLKEISDSTNPNAHPPLPIKEGSYSLPGVITAIEQPLPSHTHMFLTMRDGMTLAWDLKQEMMSGFKIGNCWSDFEQRLVRSGVPGKVKTIGGPVATCLAHNPRDLNILLIGYEGGVVAWDFQKAAAVKTFEMTLPPGAPGGGTYQDADGGLWTERNPSVTTITWRPDGLVFAVGHSDGCIAFWAYNDSEKPLMVRTLTHEDVNVTDAESLLEAGALDNQIRKKKDIIVPAVLANREPIFKLAWVSFPDAASLKTLFDAQGKEGSTPTEPVANATVEYSERNETLFLVLGGQSPGEKPGINILQMPAYLPPTTQRRGTASSISSESISLQERYAFRDSLAPTGSSNYPTRTPPEDFVLMPRTSPYFNMCHDPIAIMITLTPDRTMPYGEKPTAQREFEVYAFPPPRSNVVPPSLGRKNFLSPGEGEKLVSMTPAPIRPNSPHSPRPASPSWRFPWTASASSSPSIDAPSPSPSSLLHSPLGAGPNTKRSKHRRRYRAPSSIWSGAYSVLGCEMFSLPTPTFKRLISLSIENAGNESIPRIPLRGGLAVPDLQSHGAPDISVIKMENYRILVTFHPDATVRFWDVSPHILCLPTPLRFEYPAPLPHLTISLGEWLRNPLISHLPLAKLWANDRTQVRITNVYLARESLECVITMATGEVIITKFGDGKLSQRGDDNEVEELDGWTDSADAGKSPRTDYFGPAPTLNSPPLGSGNSPKIGGTAGQEWFEEVTEIDQLASWSADGFKPVAILTTRRGQAIKCAVSDIGFIAIAFASKTLAILDMRGPEVILREGFDEEGASMTRKKKKANVQNVMGENSLVGCLKWVVSGMGADPSPKPRLIVQYAKGMTKIYTLINVLGEWMVEQKPPTFTNDSLAGPLATYVLDPITGNELFPTAQSLSASINGSSSGPEGGKIKDKDPAPHCLWVAASKRSIRCAVNFNGEKISKVEFDQEELADVKYITRHGNRIFAAITTTGSVLFYSAPFLEYITRMDLYFGGQPRSIGHLSFDDRSGDFVEYSGPLDITLRTVFHFRKPLPPRYDPLYLKQPIGPQPTPINASSIVGSWIWGGAPISGYTLDNIVAGPNRVSKPKTRAETVPKVRKPLITWGEPPEEPPIVKAQVNTVIPKRTAVGKQRGPARDPREREDAYGGMQDAAVERGDMLDYLGEQLNNATISASNYLAQARNTAMKEAGKATIKGVFGKMT